MTSALSEEIAFWRFLDNWTGHVPWRMEKHVAVTISTDASQSRWAGFIHRQPTEIVLGDFWEVRLRVVSNFGDSDRGVGENTHTREQNSGERRRDGSAKNEGSAEN